MYTASVHGFWTIDRGRDDSAAGRPSQVFADLVDRVLKHPGALLFDVLEAGVPTEMVAVIAGAMFQPHREVLRMLGVTPATFGRRATLSGVLPPLAGHRVMALLRLAATMHRTIDKAGKRAPGEVLCRQDWLAAWLKQPMKRLGRRTPAEMLRNAEGLRVLEMEIERIWGESSEWIQVQDAFLLRARDAVERATLGVGGISPSELLKRMDDRIEAALPRIDLRSKEE